MLLLNGMALDALEDFKLDATSTCAFEKGLQAGESGCGLVIAPRSLRGQCPQSRLGDVSRAQRRIAGTFRTLVHRLRQPLHPLRVSGGQVRKSRMQVDIRPESRGQDPFERIGQLAPAAAVVDAVA